MVHEPRKCFLLPDHPAVFVQLGKYGDLMILFPGLQRIFWKTHIKPVVFVSAEFVSIFEGITYAKPWPMEVNWWRDVAKVRDMAIKLFGDAIVCKWWEIPGFKTPEVSKGEPFVELNLPNRKFTLPQKDWESYMVSQWTYSGFSREQLVDWQLDFDNRDDTREEILRRKTFITRKPKILVAMPSVGTSVFKKSPELWPRIRRLANDFEIINLEHVKAHRLYDLLGLYDAADFLITSDTATLHLASASTIPYLALVADGGSGSIPKGNCVCSVRYADAIRSIPKIDHHLQSLYDHSGSSNGNLARRPRTSNPTDTRGAAAPVQRLAALKC